MTRTVRAGGFPTTEKTAARLCHFTPASLAHPSRANLRILNRILTRSQPCQARFIRPAIYEPPASGRQILLNLSAMAMVLQ